jgi:hypothetical protein
MAEIRRDETIGTTGLSTAALARADAPESIEQDRVEMRDDDRDLNASVDSRMNAENSRIGAENAQQSPRCSQRSAPVWRGNGTGATTFQRKSCGWHCVVIARSLADYFRFSFFPERHDGRKVPIPSETFPAVSVLSPRLFRYGQFGVQARG